MTEAEGLRARLHELFSYDAEAGALRFRMSRANKAAGSIAGSVSKITGYREISVDYRSYRAHRLIWLYHRETVPAIIDHINHVRDDNRIENLREATNQQNQQNQLGNKRNSSGYKGVQRAAYGRWRATIRKGDKIWYLGHFSTPEEAAVVRTAAEIELYGEFASPTLKPARGEAK